MFIILKYYKRYLILNDLTVSKTVEFDLDLIVKELHLDHVRFKG